VLYESTQKENLLYVIEIIHYYKAI